MLSDLSRIIAQSARVPIRWAADERFTLCDAGDAVGCTATLKESVRTGWMWVVSYVSIGQFPTPSPSPSSAAADASPSALRMWTVRIDAAERMPYPGIIKPSDAPEYNADGDLHTHYVSHSSAYRGYTCKELHLPVGQAAGSLYHFTQRTYRPGHCA
jgi:hypothetical protein